jgi:hypothetical protein
MVFFSNQKSLFDIFWKAMEWNFFESIMAIWYNLLAFTYSVIIFNFLWSFWYIFLSFGMFHQEKSGNPESKQNLPTRNFCGE